MTCTKVVDSINQVIIIIPGPIVPSAMFFSALAVILASNTERRWSAIKLNVSNFLKSGFVFPVPLTNYSPHPVRPAEKEDVSDDVPPKNPIMPRKRRSNQCLQCDRYFLTQVQHS